MSDRRIARLGAAVALLFTGGFAALGTQPAQAVRPTHVNAPLASPPPALVSVVGDDGVRRVSAPARSRTDLMRMTDQSGFGALDAARAVLAQRTGLRLPDMHPASTLQHRSGDDAPAGDPVQAASHEVFGLVTAGSSPAGDLNDDGYDDVLLHRIASDGSFTRAVDGRSGQSLWQRDRQYEDQVFDVLYAPIADVTGDGRADLFSLTHAYLGSEETDTSCDEAQEACESSLTYRYRWTYGVVSSDGVDVWTQQMDASDRSVRAQRWSSNGPLSSTAEDETRRERVNTWVFLEAVRDQNADGVADVLLGSYGDTSSIIERDGRTALVVSDWSAEMPYRYSLDAQLLTGTDGSVLLSRSARDKPSLASVLPAPQLVGDSTPDLLWEETGDYDFVQSCRSVNAVVINRSVSCRTEVRQYPRQVTAIDGATLADAWTYSAEPGYGWSQPLPDLDGDGMADVMIADEYGFDRTRFLAGSDGHALWDMEAGAYIVEDLGAGRTDVVSIDWDRAQVVGDDDDDAWSYVVERRVGATGEVYGSDTVTLDTPVSGNYQWIWVQAVHGGGSPSSDLLFELSEADVDTANKKVAGKATQMVLVSGSGGILSSRHTPGDFVTLDALPDLDADGLSEAVRTTWDVEYRSGWFADYSRREQTVTTLDETALWPLPADVWLQRAGELDGVAGIDVLLSRWLGSEEEGWRYEVSGASGRTGQPLWTFTLQ